MFPKLLLSALTGYTIASCVGAQATATLKDAAAPRYFGAAIAEKYLSSANDTKFAELAAKQFSSATPENEMKWESVEPTRGEFTFAPGDAVVAFAKKNGQKLRCHNLVWHSQLAPFMANLTGPDVITAMLDHIEAVAGHWKDDCYAWDVVNEPFNDDAKATFRNSTFYNVMGSNYIELALLKVRSVAPNVKLYLNDYNIEGVNTKSDAMYALAKSLKMKGLLDGVGLEGHLVLNDLPTDIEANMKRFADLGLDVAVTELDIRGMTPFTQTQLEQQAQQYAMVAKACKSVSRCVGITTWGIGDAYSWIPDVFEGEGEALLWTKDYAEKPALAATIAALQG